MSLCRTVLISSSLFLAFFAGAAQAQQNARATGKMVTVQMPAIPDPARVTLDGVEMNSIPLVKLGGHDRVFKDDDFDVSCVQSADDGRDICVALLLRTEEAQVVAAGVENHDRCSGWYGGINAPQHSSRRVEAHSGIRDVRVIALGPEHGLQTGRIRLLRTDAPARRVAGAERHDVQHCPGGAVDRDARA